MTFYILFFALIIFFAFVIRSRYEKRNTEIKIQKLSREIDTIYKQYNLIANDEVSLSTNQYLIGFLCNTIGLNLINFGFLPQSIDGLKLVEKCFNYTNIDFNISEINPDLLKQKGGSFNKLELSKGDLIIMERNRLTIENNQNFIKGISDSVNFIGVKKDLLGQEILNEREIKQAYEDTKKSNFVFSPEIVAQNLLKIYFQESLNLK